MQRIRKIRDGHARRVLIVDAHVVSLAACAALLRTEGCAVAEGAPGDDVIELARAFGPDVLLIDPGPTAQCHQTALQLSSLDGMPPVLITSSTDHARLHPLVRALPFLAKADICAGAIARALAAVFDDRAVATESQ